MGLDISIYTLSEAEVQNLRSFIEQRNYYHQKIEYYDPKKYPLSWGNKLKKWWWQRKAFHLAEPPCYNYIRDQGEAWYFGKGICTPFQLSYSDYLQIFDIAIDEAMAVIVTKKDLLFLNRYRSAAQIKYRLTDFEKRKFRQIVQILQEMEESESEWFLIDASW